MAFILCYLLAFAFFNYAEAQQLQSNISLGSALTPTTNSSWASRSGMYAFGFYKQGNGFAVGIVVAGIPERTVVWTANRDGGLVSDNASLLFTSAGIALRSTQGQSLVIGENNVSSASMMDSGNFVLYNASGAIVWQSFRYPTDTLLPTQPLLAGKELLSAKSETNHSSGIFRLAMQVDGNLVQYPVDTGNDSPYSARYAYYASYTDRSGTNVSLNLGVNGRLYLLNDTGGILKNLFDGATRGWSYLARIDADGIFRVYSYDLKQKGNWSIEWSSSEDRCVPKGACGVNSYCVTMGARADCPCLPGFEYVNPGDQTLGCESNSSVVDVCKLKNSNCSYAILELGSTTWENEPYMQLSSSGKEDCKQACLDDLNCQAAIFDGSTCIKQRPPLRYGRRDMSTPNILFIKEVVMSSVPPAPDAVVPKGSRKDDKKLFLIIGVSFTALGSILLVISVILLWKHNVWAYKRMNELNGDAEWNEDGAPRPYAYEELVKMTNNFNEEVGRGASGTVYKGAIANSQKLVAVKRLEKVATGEGDKEFQNEMRVIGRTHHRNLVHLHGYCLDGPKKLLVYEYMSNGSLADILFTSEGKPNWEERMGIARNIARGFLYLHEECDKQIIHCDIKPQNILMDEYMCPKIADFGLAKLLQQDQTRTTTGIRGTKGYVAPEWHRKMPITVKADVYSFGIVLLEIVCCRRNVDLSLPHDEAILDDLVYHYFESGQLEKLVGDEEINIRQLERVVRVAIWCIQDEPSLRPSMKKVLLMLEGTVDIPVPPSPVSFLSTI
ncbi:G-type lectin S-receptor-like serine/threonine-protein kinase LECRK3 [Argentina anserina]|uniref:G-type lectin S-receptor-like serine/threonine-protein kinase LECRK3 n=1 Tax=Argentina anserina TaxID=57926 RepID=UPI0021765863|nr:G-type lectin S-receptor-like serine/threonine-protein kinase LECRK3 [Potentilla anserina]